VLRSASSLCTIASGGSIGREGAMVQLAAATGSWIGQLGRFEGDKLRLHSSGCLPVEKFPTCIVG
jgi:CIC family chloride channel protein